MPHDDRAFDAYRASPGRDTLRALLSAHQATVFHLCLRVLRSTHDAEDAAQDALLEIARGASGVREPRAFKRWLCRVALHTALDHLRRRSRRSRHEEQRAAMIPSAPDPALDALHDALSKLGDEDRCLLVEKYFDRATLREIAAREDVSVAAAGKRVDRAKERLKRALQGAGFAAVVPRVDGLLDGAASATPVPDLVSSSAAVKAAIALTGGAVMGAKSAAPAVAAGIVVLMLLIGAGTYVTRRHPPAAPPAAVPVPPAETAVLPDPAIERAPAARDAGPAAAEAAPISPSPEELVERLERLKDWFLKNRPAFKTAADIDLWFQEAKREAEGLRELILANPRAFLDWLASPDNSPIASNLIAVTLAGKKTQWDAPSQEFASLPRELTDGLLEWTHGSDVYLQVAFLQLSLTLKDAPASYRDRYLAQLAAAEPLVRELAAKALLTTGDLSPPEAGAIAGYLERVDDFDARTNLFQSIGRVPKEEIRDWLLTTLESGRFEDPDGRLTYAALAYWLERSPGPVFEDRAGRILGSALRRVKNSQAYFYLVFGAVSLPWREAKALLAEAATSAPSVQLRKAAASLMAQPESGLRTTEERRGAWLDAYWKKD